MNMGDRTKMQNISEDLPIQKVRLHCPPLEEVAEVIRQGLQENFADVQVNVVDCPDLREKPFMLANQGLSGSPRVADIGGVPNLIPLVKREKIYNLEAVPALVEVPNAFMVGAGAGPAHHVGVNSEMMPNMSIEGKVLTNNTHICKMKGSEYVLQKFESCTDCCLLMNLFISEGKPGKVLEVKASKRTGETNYMKCIRTTLADHYGEKPVAVGGAFLVQTGKVKIHVMPDFSKVPLNSDEEVDNWLTFHEMAAPLVCLGYLVSHDPDLDLRMEHFHCFSDHGDGGHYHYDTTPDQVEYRGYLNVAEYMYRIDRPTQTHMIGRD